MNANSDNHEPTPVNVADQLLDRALAEVVGGERPPDLSELILAGKRPSEQIIADRVSRRRLSRRALVILTLAAIILVAAAPLILSSVTSSHDQALNLALSQNHAGIWETTTASTSSPATDTSAPAVTLPPPSPGPAGPTPPVSAAIPAPARGQAALPQLAAEGRLGPVDVRFIEGSNIVIVRGREEDVAQVRQTIKEIEAAGKDGSDVKSLRAAMEAAHQVQQQVEMAGKPETTQNIDLFFNTGQRGQSQYGFGNGAAPGRQWFGGTPGLNSTSPAKDTGFGAGGTTDRYSQFGDGLDSNGTASAGGLAYRGAKNGRGEVLSVEMYDAGDLVRNGRDSREKSVELGDQLKMSVTPRIITNNSDNDDVAALIDAGGPRPDKMSELGTGPGLSGDQYVRIFENPFVKAEGGAAVSTFSIDVDTASYANVRRFLLTENTLPPPDAVRLEELVNYFKYDYAPPAGIAKTQAEPAVSDDAAKDSVDKPTPFAAHIEVAGCPWKPDHRLVRIGIKGQEMDRRERPKSNLVFLVDVSGSMDEPNKLPLVVDSLKELARELGENDRVAIVVYAQQEGLVLGSTPGSQRETIIGALDRLRAGGSTAGGAGIQLAYQIAEDNFIAGGTNRVILCTDGDFNVGVTSTAELERMVEQKAKDTKVFLSVLGFGRGNLNDQMMEAISNHGNGNYSYVDSLREARRVFVDEMAGTLVTIAKDVKIQVEFNPKQVAGYRLVGYENRMLRTEDFNDDKKDAGEIGAGHTVTALYEFVPAGKPVDLPPVDELKYQQPPASPDRSRLSADESIPDITGELLTLKMKYKRPDSETSEDTLEWPVTDDGKPFSAASQDFQFAAAVAGFGMLLRGSEHKGNLTYAAVLELAEGAIGSDEHGYRRELVEMIRRAKSLKAE